MQVQDTEAPTRAPAAAYQEPPEPDRLRLLGGRASRRFYRIEEAAEQIGMAPETVTTYIRAGTLPVVRLRALQGDRPALKVPAIWIEGSRWLDMADKDRPVITSQAAIMEAATGPWWLRVRDAATVLAVSRGWLYDAIAAGVFPRPSQIGGQMRVRRQALDEWVYELVHDAETRWYGQRVMRAAERPDMVLVAGGGR